MSTIPPLVTPLLSPCGSPCFTRNMIPDTLWDWINAIEYYFSAGYTTVHGQVHDEKVRLKWVALVWRHNIGNLQWLSQPSILTWQDMKQILVSKNLHDNDHFTWHQKPDQSQLWQTSVFKPGSPIRKEQRVFQPKALASTSIDADKWQEKDSLTDPQQKV